MSKVVNDRRALRTKKMIRKALAELIEEKGFSGITITDLTMRADINRGTFYLHYIDKYDLLEKIENEVLQELLERIKSGTSKDLASTYGTNKPLPFTIKVFQYIKENSVFMKAILGPKGEPTFQRKLKKLIKTHLFEQNEIPIFQRKNLLIPEEYFISYVLSAHFGVIQQWLEGDMKETPEDMALILTKMFFLGPFRVAGLRK